MYDNSELIFLLTPVYLEYTASSLSLETSLVFPSLNSIKKGIIVINFIILIFSPTLSSDISILIFLVSNVLSNDTPFI